MRNKLVELEVVIMARSGERPAILIKQATSSKAYAATADEDPHDHSVWHKHTDTYQQKQARYWEEKVARIMTRIADRRAA